MRNRLTEGKKKTIMTNKEKYYLSYNEISEGHIKLKIT